MPKKTGLSLIFDSFVADLGKIVKERISEAVEAATKEFFSAEKAPKAATEAKKDKPKGKKRGRRPGRPKKAVVEAKAIPVQKTKAKTVKKSAPRIKKAISVNTQAEEKPKPTEKPKPKAITPKPKAPAPKPKAPAKEAPKQEAPKPVAEEIPAEAPTDMGKE